MDGWVRTCEHLSRKYSRRSIHPCLVLQNLGIISVAVDEEGKKNKWHAFNISSFHSYCANVASHQWTRDIDRCDISFIDMTMDY